MKAVELKNIVPIISYDFNNNIVVVSNQELFFFIKMFEVAFQLSV